MPCALQASSQRWATQLFPSEVLFLTTIFAVKLRDEIFRDPSVLSVFLRFKNQLSVFVKSCFSNRASESERIFQTLNQSCSEGHKFIDYVPKIAEKTFNFTAQNFCTAVNDAVHKKEKEVLKTTPVATERSKNCQRMRE
jgi:hypothetical protein